MKRVGEIRLSLKEITILLPNDAGDNKTFVKNVKQLFLLLLGQGPNPSSEQIVSIIVRYLNQFWQNSRFYVQNVFRRLPKNRAAADVKIIRKLITLASPQDFSID